MLAISDIITNLSAVGTVMSINISLTQEINPNDKNPCMALRPEINPGHNSGRRAF